MQFSVVICSYNSRQDYLLRVLDAVFSQEWQSEEFEVILVDNCSNPPVSSWLPQEYRRRLNLVEEKQAGLTQARRAGVAASRADWIVFVDDDNVIDNQYLKVASGIIDGFPHLGAFGSGSIQPEFEVVPEPDLHAYLPLLAIRSESKAVWSNLGDYRAFPCGAGMCARRDLMKLHFDGLQDGSRRANLDRKGNSLSSAGDTDMLYSVVSQGFGTGVFPSLSLIHLMPAARVSRSYLQRLAYSISYSLTILEQERCGVPMTWAGRLIETIRSLGRVITNGRGRKMVWQSQSGRIRAIWGLPLRK